LANVTDAKKRRRPSAKEAKARMTRAVATPSPMSRAEEEPDDGIIGSGEGTEDTRQRETGAEEGAGRRRRGGSGSAAEEEKLVRLSVDVPRAQHRFLRVEAAQAGTTGMAVVRALISEMEADEDLAERIRSRLESE
jgi:hypothetical protein